LGDTVGGEAEERGSVLVGQTLDLGHPQHGSPPFRERGEGATQQPGVLVGDDLVQRARAAGSILEAVGVRSSSAPLAGGIQGEVLGGDEQIGTEGTTIVQPIGRKGSQDPFEGVADDVVGIAVVAEHRPGHAASERGVALVELGERR